MDRRRFAKAVALSLVVLAAVAALSVWLAPARLGPGDGELRFILLDVRLPRVVVGMLIGAILAAAGATFQNLLRNSLADPFILGVSGGAACAAAVATSLGLASSAAAIALAAFAGSAAATLGVFFLARRRGSVDATRLIIAGLILNSFFSAVILLALSSTRGADLSAALRWMMGSLSAAGWNDAAVLGVALAVAGAGLQWMASDLRLLVFGEEDARSRGVNVERLKIAGFLLASIATGAAVAVGGIIGFVGLLVPHWVRTVWSFDIRGTLLLSMIGGAALLVAADAAARTLRAPAELPVGALLAVVGVPFFVAMLRSSR